MKNLCSVLKIFEIIIILVYFSASYAAPAPTAPTGLGILGNFNIGLPGIFNTALTVVLALVGLTMLIDVRNSKILNSSYFLTSISQTSRKGTVKTNGGSSWII